MTTEYPSLSGISSTLISAVQALSLSHSIDEITKIVRKSARKMVNADGATFVLRDEDRCFYIDEDAIGPLWKGMKFPLSSCISGWTMLNKQQVVIPDIYVDSRIPIDAYRPTFVKSLTMTPIRKNAPIGAIGAYWSDNHNATPEECDALQALADSASIAITNVSALSDLETRAKELEATHQKLNSLTWLVYHDLKEPLRAINLHLELLDEERQVELTPAAAQLLNRIKISSHTAHKLALDLLSIFELGKMTLTAKETDLNQALDKALLRFQPEIASSKIHIQKSNLPIVNADEAMIGRVFQNLISNAIKFKKADIPLELDISSIQEGSHWKILVKDNGIGIAPEYHTKIFEFFSRLHSRSMFPGNGCGLALCREILEEFDGTISVSSKLHEGSCFSFTLPRAI